MGEGVLIREWALFLRFARHPLALLALSHRRTAALGAVGLCGAKWEEAGDTEHRPQGKSSRIHTHGFETGGKRTPEEIPPGRFNSEDSLGQSECAQLQSIRLVTLAPLFRYAKAQTQSRRICGCSTRLHHLRSHARQNLRVGKVGSGRPGNGHVLYLIVGRYPFGAPLSLGQALPLGTFYGETMPTVTSSHPSAELVVNRPECSGRSRISNRYSIDKDTWFQIPSGKKQSRTQGVKEYFR